MSTHEQFADDLVLLALGELAEARAAELRGHMDSCADCRREFQQLQSNLSLIALSVEGAAPSAKARERFIRAVERESKVSQMVQSRPRWWSLAPMFASALLAIFAILLWVENTELREKLNIASADIQGAESDLARARDVLATLSSPEAMRITLVSVQEKPQPQVKVIYRKDRSSLVLLANNLAPLPEKKAYELWLIPADGSAPINAGVFKPDAKGSAMMMMPPMPKQMEAKAFAITIENEAGSAAPTSPILMMGAAGSQP